MPGIATHPVSRTNKRGNRRHRDRITKSGRRNFNGKQRRSFFPQEYVTSALVTAAVIVFGFVLELLFGNGGLAVPSWPNNLYLLIGFAGFLGVVTSLWRTAPLIVWLSGIPSAICFIAGLGLLAVVAGSLPQDAETQSVLLQQLGLDHVVRGWPFALTAILLLSNLGIVTIRKLFPFRTHNIRFLLNHAGLWIIVAAATLGAGDLQRVVIVADEGQTVDYGYVAENQTVALPFTLSLKDFRLEEYPRRLALLDVQTGALVAEDAFLPAETGDAQNLYGWQISVERFLPAAMPDADGATWLPSQAEGAVAAAQVHAVFSGTGATRDGWVTSGSYRVKTKGLRLGYVGLVMTPPKPRKFQSDVVLNTRSEKRTAVIEVNKPVAVAGWKLYQTSYDEKRGKWSHQSIIEAVRDPWLPVVYAGIFLLLAGTACILWTGVTTKGEK